MSEELCFWAVDDDKGHTIPFTPTTTLEVAREYLKEYTLMFGAAEAELHAVWRCACGCGGAHPDRPVGRWKYSAGQEIDIQLAGHSS